MVIRTDTFFSKLVASVVTASIIAAGGSGMASYVEIKLLRNDLSSTVKAVESMDSKVDSLEARVNRLESFIDAVTRGVNK
jgi:outer membrane murein-binding lipoprotein Lpp